MAKNAEKVQTALADANAVAQETLGSMRTVFSFANEDQVCHSVKNVARPRILSCAKSALDALYFRFSSTKSLCSKLRFPRSCVKRASAAAEY